MSDESKKFDPDAWMEKQRPQPRTFDPDAWVASQGLPGLPSAPPGSQPTKEETDEAFRDVGKTALEYTPAALATIGSIAAPEFLPATLAARAGLIGWGARTAASIGGAGTGGALGSGVQQTFDDKELPFLERLKLAGKEGGKQAASEALGTAITAPLQLAGHFFNPKRLYQSALKPQTKLAPEKVAEIIETGLREKIPVSEAGFFKTAETTDALNKQIAEIIETRSKQVGDAIDPKAVAKRADEAREAFNKWHQVNPEADVETITKAKEQFLRQHSVDVPYTKLTLHKSGPNKGKPMLSEEGGFSPEGEIGGASRTEVQNITPAQAQQIKQGTYTRLRDKYGELGSADTEAQKALARGLKEEIVKLFPELKKLNARDSALIDLEQQLAKFVNREGNKQMVGLGQMIAAGGVAAAGDPTSGLMLLMLKGGLDDPYVKSRLAIALRHVSLPIKLLRNSGKIAGAGIRVGMAEDGSRAQPQLGTLGAPGVFARGGRMRDPLGRTPDLAAMLCSLRAR